MARFNLHTVIETTEELEQDLKTIIAAFHEALGSIGHKVTNATLTSDAGQTNVTPPEPVEEPEPEPDEPAPAAPVKSTLDDVSS